MWQIARLIKSRDIFISIALLSFTLTHIVSHVECLYEDQVGKFDWTKHYVGKVNKGFHDDRFGYLLVFTEENVIAALNVDNGDIVWRRILEKGDRGSVQHLQYLNDETINSNSLRVSSRQEPDRFMITVAGTSFISVRIWNIRTGNLAWEWTMQLNNAREEKSHWFSTSTTLYHVQPAWDASNIEVSAYNIKTGHAESNTRQIPAGSVQKQDCDFVQSFMICTYAGESFAIDLISGARKSLSKSSVRHEVVNGNEASVLINRKVYDLQTLTNTAVTSKGASPVLFYTRVKSTNAPILLEATLQDSNIEIKVKSAENEDVLLSSSTNYPKHFDTPRVIDASCKINKKSDFVCRTVLTTDNAAIFQLQSGKIKWIREESLADIAAIEMVDLPLSDSEGAIEKQLKSDNDEKTIDWDILGNFVQRLSTQLNHVRHLLRTIFDVVSTHQIPTKGELTRDAFGLHTIIVVLTTSGKVFGIDNISGKQHYVTNLPNFGEFANGLPMKIVVQRTSKHFPYPAQCTILARHKLTGNGLVYQFNPIDGSPINGGFTELNYPIRQISVLQPGADFLRGILLLDKNNGVHIFPESAAETAHGTFTYVSDVSTGIVTGYYIGLNNNQLQATENWRINLGGLDNSQKILKIASKNPNEHVHSQGRVLNDRSVLYKYINPNLVAIVTQGTDNVYKYVLNVHLVDVVSGGIVTTITHRRVKGPVNIVHSENWLVYSYYNDKVRRTELTTIELYEGNTQANSTVWTSFDAPPLPAIEQQAYIIPATIVSMRETITEKGITNKHVLIGLSTGAVVEMPWHLLDPRRPVLNTNQPREEGTIPYIPELPLSSESVINYNQSISRIKGIYTAPSGLESTCLVVAYGLDFFSVRISPSRTFDLLKEDFDYITLTSVLVALTVASFVVKHMSAKKTLKQAWK